MRLSSQGFSFCLRTSKGHGRLEVRALTTSSQLNDFLDWPFLLQVFRLERRVTLIKTGQVRTEVTFGITSLPAEQAGPARLLHRLRSYWRIENDLHYRGMLPCVRMLLAFRPFRLDTVWRSSTI